MSKIYIDCFFDYIDLSLLHISIDGIGLIGSRKIYMTKDNFYKFLEKYIFWLPNFNIDLEYEKFLEIHKL